MARKRERERERERERYLKDRPVDAIKRSGNETTATRGEKCIARNGNREGNIPGLLTPTFHS